MKDLGFVDGSNFWAVAPTGDWSTDNEIGRGFGEELLVRAKALGAPNLLGSVVRAMVHQGRCGGIEAGFLSVVFSAALAATPMPVTHLHATHHAPARHARQRDLRVVSEN